MATPPLRPGGVAISFWGPRKPLRQAHRAPPWNRKNGQALAYRIGPKGLGDQQIGCVMADKTALGFFGFFLASVTLVVTIVAFLAVRDTVQGRFSLDGNSIGSQLTAAQSARN